MHKTGPEVPLYRIYNPPEPFETELGELIEDMQIGYHTLGTFVPGKTGVIWICHAFTGNSNPSEWWPGLVGKGKLYDPDRHFIVCANVPGSCYGTTGPLSLQPSTGKPRFRSFPKITIRDMANTLEILRLHLGIDRIHTVIGGSLGGFQAMEWNIMKPELFKHAVFIACLDRSSPWVIAYNESQRMAIEADPSFATDSKEGGLNGLKAARSIALLSYRTIEAYNSTQKEEDINSYNEFKASSYQQYQGVKLVRRFDAYSYYTLTQAMDSHNVGRGRGGVVFALRRITAETLCIGISDDYLFPAKDVRSMSRNIIHASYAEIETPFGHDGFLVESEKLTSILESFYFSSNKNQISHEY